MKKKSLSLYYITLALICQVLLSNFLFVPVSAVSPTDTNDFHFDSFDADYYLSKDSEGISHLKVVETLEAVFPVYDQNHGIERTIPFTNQDNKNITLEDLNQKNLTVTRNGTLEPFEITKENYLGQFSVRIGSADYFVHGHQTYQLSYEFEKVITDFNDFQELYWDTNGTGWAQPFDHLSATIHFSDGTENYWTGKSWCYVGRFGESGQNRCQTEQVQDGIRFSTNNLSSGENLTFDLEFKPSSFTIPEPEVSYKIPIVLGIEILIFGIVAFLEFKFLKSARENRKIYKSIFVAPEYSPIENLSLYEASEISLKPTRNASVATLIDLAVRKKIEIKKEDGNFLSKYKWTIITKDLEGISNSEQITLDLLNGGKKVDSNSLIEVKHRTYSYSAEALARNLDKYTEKLLKQKNLILEKTSSKAVLLPAIVTILIFFFLPIEESTTDTYKILFLEELEPLIFLFPFIFFPVMFFLVIKTLKFDKYTEKGLKTTRRLEGLKLFITMTEEERLKTLQSVKGADTSDQGIVKLYEKLLPYAILFGVEKSWQQELEKYYTATNTEVPIYVSTTTFSSFSHSVSSDISSSSGSSSSSSSSSGGGGGGSSGGGGGGGGGGGW